MTPQELRDSLSIVSTSYNKELDGNILALWTALFIEFDVVLFRRACFEIVASSKFFPNINEILEAYKRVRVRAEDERYERMKNEQRLLSAGQEYCYLCDNSGYCLYTVSGCEYVSRCGCLHGRDLNKFSESQIERDCRPESRDYYTDGENSAIKRGKNPFYLPTIREMMSKEDYTVFDAQRKAQFLTNENTAIDERKMELLRKTIYAQS